MFNLGLRHIKQTINKFEELQKKSIDIDGYNTGLIGEKLIIATFRDMPIEKLEQYRYVLNKEIKKKKELKRVYNATNDRTWNDNL